MMSGATLQHVSLTAPGWGRPMCFAHRGACHEAPENTLAAFRRAAELGADGIELDVHLSRDGHLVVIHDFGLEATTDGHGAVEDKTLAELKELDAGSWFGPQFTGEQIPTLQEVFDAVGHQLLINIELKTTKKKDDGLPSAVVRLVEANKLDERVIVSSFSRLAIRRVRQLSPRIPIGYLYYFDPLLRQRPWPRQVARPDALHPWYRMINEEYVRWARAAGYRVHTWTVDDPEAMRRLVAWGLDIIITNRPDLLRQVIAAS